MDKLTFGKFQSGNTDIAFASTNDYDTPTSELETRKQLSYPLKEIKDFVNKTVAVNSKNDDASVIQLVLDSGVLKYRNESLSTAPLQTPTPFTFVGMVVSGTNLATEADVQAIYGASTSWTLLSSVAIASEHIVGNGKALGLTNGKTSPVYGGMGYSSSTPRLRSYTAAYGANLSDKTGGSGSGTLADGDYIGVPTKTQLGVSLENSGLILDTVTCYTWERTA